MEKTKRIEFKYEEDTISRLGHSLCFGLHGRQLPKCQGHEPVACRRDLNLVQEWILTDDGLKWKTPMYLKTGDECWLSSVRVPLGKCVNATIFNPRVER
jgi:hypothetical protein